MVTRQKILQTALQQYNKEGLSVITSRHIAKELAMSPGNLHYHFRHTEDIIKALYGQLTDRFDNIFNSIDGSEEISMNWFSEMLDESFNIIYEYRFVFLNITHIVKRIPELRDEHASLIQKRQEQFGKVFHKLITAKVLRDDIPEQIWSNLVIQIFLICDCYLTYNEITHQYESEQAKREFIKIYDGLLFPYLIR